MSDPVHQDDQAYASARWQFGDSKIGVSFLRLRTVAGRHYFTLKQPVDNDQACLEHETEVTGREAVHHVAPHMGYRPTVRIVKARRTASIDGCSLCIDDLDGVGGFVEAERMVPDDADAQAVQAVQAGSPRSWSPWALRRSAPPRRTTPWCTRPSVAPATNLDDSGFLLMIIPNEGG